MAVAASGLTESFRRDSAAARKGLTAETARRDEKLTTAVNFSNEQSDCWNALILGTVKMEIITLNKI